MVKIIVGGQIDKADIAKMIEEIGGDQVEVEIKSDLAAANAIKQGKADYYIGACNTGGGGALAMAIAILGRQNTASVSAPGNIKSDEEIIKEVQSGKKAFGFTAQHKDSIVPVLVKEILNQEK
ncbi:DUF2620 domain-containing protein [Alkalibacterium iburiense]|uniref:DUF2620 domain-containing protein n=1 Tax=Alkalibacterium iburiense TaxID=290589 RepID=A0ABN0X7M3_9LACT